MAFDRHEGFATSIIARMLGTLFIAVGSMKIFQLDLMEDAFQRWTYTLGFMRTVGVIEVVSGLLLLSVETRIWGALVLAPMMFGAAFTHLVHGDPAWMLVPLTALGFLWLLIYNRTKIYLRRRGIHH